MKKAHFISVAILAAGVLIATECYRISLTSPPPAGYLAYCDTAIAAGKPCLTEVEKNLIESQDSLSKWLLGLAYTTLGGMLILRVKNWRSTQVTSALPMIACALLVLSLFGAFLFQIGIVFTLSNGPLYHLDTGVVWVPLLTQFWSLVGALALLALWLYGPRRGIRIALLFAAAASSPHFAQAAGIEQCAQQWQETHGFTADAKLAATQAQLVELLAKRAEVAIPSSCDFTDSVLDRVRFAAREVKHSRSASALAEYTDSLVEELQTNAVSPEEITNALVRGLKFWEAPSALVILRASRTKDATIDTMSCMTPCTVRIGPGAHKIQASDAGKIIYSCPVNVKADAVLRIDVEAGRCPQ
ncbi:MAG TPA: hypothetical protein VG675_19575 [Bryobacteraceae bacterium]|nr:hypothetical protein [Bryobacteraceae bacterium]